MTKYYWQQRYALDRFDLEGAGGRLVGWIYGNPNCAVTNLVTRDSCSGYVLSYETESSVKPKWTWKIFWVERDEDGFYKKETSTDGMTYTKMSEAKTALQEKFGIKEEEARTVNWSGNLTKYE